MKPYYQDELVTLYHGDCREVWSTGLEPVGAVLVTDPPYGISSNSNRRLHAYKDPIKSGGRIGGSVAARATEYGATSWDDEPLNADTWRWLKATTAAQVVWGANHLFEVLGKAPRTLVWDKKCRNGWVDSFSDCELAWCSTVGPDRMYRHLWMGMLRATKEERFHPTQKPLALMAWSLTFVPDGEVLDPFAGSGSTLVAAKAQGRRAIGVELNEAYCEIAATRLTEDTLFGGIA